MSRDDEADPEEDLVPDSGDICVYAAWVSGCTYPGMVVEYVLAVRKKDDLGPLNPQLR